jgi:hypothetical protein
MKLANFLKKYSVINDEFIDDYHTFFDEKADELMCTINLYDIAKWLDIKEEKLKKLLINNFKEHIDYIIDKKNINNLVLSPKCSKLLCMMSESEKANLIRTYHTDLEKLIVKYKDVKNEIRYILYKVEYNKIHQLDPNDKYTCRLELLNEVKQKLKTEIFEFQNAYSQIDSVFTKEIKYAELRKNRCGYFCFWENKPESYYKGTNPIIDKYFYFIFADT